MWRLTTTLVCITAFFTLSGVFLLVLVGIAALWAVYIAVDWLAAWETRRKGRKL